MKVSFRHYPLHFKLPAGTSRGIMQVKNSWIIEILGGERIGLGEVSIIEGLSPEFISIEQFERAIQYYCELTEQGIDLKDQSELDNYPSILFGLESALLDLKNGGKQIYFSNEFSLGTKRLPINGLIWMGSPEFMQEQIDQKLSDGFTTLKMKIGAIGIDTELHLLRSIRKKYSAEQITLRVDANGAFTPSKATEILKELSELEIHSIEQPIAPGQREQLKLLCDSTPVPIALDEELIGIRKGIEKQELLDTIQPQFIILKPSLHGGITGVQEWIRLAEERAIGWWMTSALESNIGLKVICQLTAEYDNPLPQGLGTGSLYTNNFPSELCVEHGTIYIKKGDN